MEGFEIEHVGHNDIDVLYVRGYLDAHTAPDLENMLQGLADKNRFKILVNFKELNYISSAGLGVFMGYIELIRANKGDIKLSNMSPKIFRVFDLLGFPALYQIFDDETEAKAKFTEA